MRINLVLIGAPGSGKGTQAVRLARRYGAPHVSTGDILRDAVRAATPLGREVAAVMARGELVGDELMDALVGERLARPDAARGFVLDGFPRTVAQARALDAMPGASPLIVVLLEVLAEEIVGRLSRRRVCRSCRLTQSAPAGEDPQGGSCPYCGGTLVRRDDDDPATVRRRLATYEAFAEPLVTYYRQRPGFIAVDGLRQPDEVTAGLIAEIERTLKEVPRVP